MKNIYFTFLLAVVAISCNKSREVLPFDISKAQEQIVLNPDSIANILEEQINPANLSDKDKADYWFLLTQTHLQQGRSLINDSLIHFSVEYYNAKNAPCLSAAYRLAAYQINWSGNKNAEEETFLLKALDVGKNKGDTVEVIKTYNALANFYFKIREHSKTIDIHKRIIELSSSLRTKSISTCMIGLEYAMLGAKDSCFVYFDKAIELAKKKNDKSLLYDMLRSYADCLNRFGNSKKAIDVINQANRLSGDYNNKYYANFTFLNAYLNLNQLDSAKIHLDYLEKNNATIPPTNESYFYVNYITAALRSIYNEKRGLPIDMLSIMHHGDNVMFTISQNMKADKERIFIQNKLSKEKSRLEIEKAQQLQIYLIIIILLLLFAGIITFIYQRKLFLKEKAIQLAKERLQQHTMKLYENETIIRENEILINDLTSQLEESGDYEERLADIEQMVEANKSLQIQNDLLHGEITKYSTILNERESDLVGKRNIALQERERFLLDQLIVNHNVLNKLKYTPRFIKEEQWPEIVNIINVLYNSYAVRLQAEYPSLTEEDIRYCCLIELRLTTSNIGTLMAVSPASVSKRKQRIKEKMSKVNSELFSKQSLENYLWNF